MKELHFVNLTNGIEWLEILPPDVSFCRIESTAIEKEDWARVFRDLDANLLMNLAIGNTCNVYDCGALRRVGKVISVGIPRIRETLHGMWVEGIEYEARTDELRAVKRKLMYFRRFLRTDMIRLVGHSFGTSHDGDRKFYRGKIEKWDRRTLLVREAYGL